MKLSQTFVGWSALALVGLASCSSAESTVDAGSSTPTLEVPGTASVDQGRSIKIAVKTTGEAGPLKIEPSAGLTAWLHDNELSVTAGYDAPAEGTVTVTTAKGEAKATVKLAVRLLDWKERPTWKDAEGPVAREHGSFFVDDDKRLAYMLHGSGYAPYGEPVNDAFVFDIATRKWAPWTPTGDVPEAAGSRRVARAAAGGNVYYAYAGYLKENKDDASLYRVDLGNPQKTFTKLTYANEAPIGRSLHAFAFDPQGSRFAVFGGFSYTASGVQSDTWIGTLAGDTVTWKKLDTPTQPSARYGSFTAFDPKTRKFVVWSGAQKGKGSDPVNAAQDAWVLDLSLETPTWSELPLGDTAPPGRRNGCGTFEPESQRLFVFGGTKDAKASEKGLWALDLSAKEPRFSLIERAAQPPLRSSGFGFVDAKTHDVICGFGNDDKLYQDLPVLGYAP